MNFGNHRYTNEQNCILFICKCDVKKLRKIVFAPHPPPPHPKTVPTALNKYSTPVYDNLCR